METKELLIGDPAPELRVGKVVKGRRIETFEPGKIYVIECWGTWCGPCLDVIPHLTQLQASFPDVHVIGVAVHDPDEDKVVRFVAEQGDEMGYAVATDGPIENPAGQESGWVAKHWLRASFSRGVPTSFVVDGKGRVAWIGHPASLDEVLPLVIDETWDIEETARQHRAGLDGDKVREGFALESIISARSEAGDKRGMIEAFDEAFAAHPALEGQWWQSKLEILLDIDRPAALIYAEHQVTSATPEDGHNDLYIGQILIQAATDGDTGMLVANRKALFDKGLEYMLACERRIAGETPNPHLACYVATSIVDALMLSGAVEDAKSRAVSAVASAEADGLPEDAFADLRAHIERCEGAETPAKAAGPTVVCDGDVCVIVPPV